MPAILPQLVLCILLAVFSLPSTGLPEVVRYTDAHGTVHYVDAISKIPPEYRDQKEQTKPLPKINREGGIRFVDTPDLPAPPRAAGAGKTVEIFVTSWCPYCRQLEASLKANQVTYIRYDIERNPEGERKYRALGGGGIPITKVGDAVIRGNNPQGILRALGR